MTTTYSIEQSDTDDESKQITIEETKEVTTTKTISVSNLKAKHSRILTEILTLESRADEIVDEIQAINDDEGIALTVNDIPKKLLVATK